jgi:hypothetical protein
MQFLTGGGRPLFRQSMGSGRERHLHFFPFWPCSAALYSSRATGVGPFLFTSLNFRFCHNCRHHRRQSFVAFSSFWGGMYQLQLPPADSKGQASQAAGTWPGGRRMRMGVLTNHLGSSNHFVFNSRIKGQTTKCLLNIRSRWASR